MPVEEPAVAGDEVGIAQGIGQAAGVHEPVEDHRGGPAVIADANGTAGGIGIVDTAVDIRIVREVARVGRPRESSDVGSASRSKPTAPPELMFLSCMYTPPEIGAVGLAGKTNAS